MDTTTNSNRNVLPRILQQHIRNTHTLRRPLSNRKNKQTNIPSILNRIKKHNPELRIRERRHQQNTKTMDKKMKKCCKTCKYFTNWTAMKCFDCKYNNCWEAKKQ